jgi:hypothetical protein
MLRHSKTMNQRYSESNGLPKDEDIKLKKRRTFERNVKYIYHQSSRLSRVSHFNDDNQDDIKATHQACSANLPIRDMRKACEMHIHDTLREFYIFEINILNI